MSFTVIKTVNDASNIGEFHSAAERDSELGPIFESIASDGTNNLQFTFWGDGPLTTAQQSALDDLSINFTYDPTSAIPRSQEVSSTSDFNTTSTTPIPITNMAMVPPEGAYYATFSTAGSTSLGSTTITLQIAIDGVVVPQSVHRATTNTSNTIIMMTTHALIEVDGTEEVTIELGTSGGAATIKEHTFCVLGAEL